MFKIISKYFLNILTITLLSKPTLAITGKDISEIVSDWLVSEGVNGKPVFSNSSVYKDCNNNLEIKKIYNNYRTVKVNCSDKKGYQLLIRVKIPNKKTNEKTSKDSIVKPKKIYKNKLVKIKKNRTYKVLRLKQSLEKNDIIGLGDIELIEVSNSSQKSFFSYKKELVGRKIKKNLKMGQLLHPRHLYEKYEVNNGDIISIVSNIGNASVTVSGEAQGSGNLGDLIKVKNLRSGKTIKGYIKKDKIIRVFR
ncbi:flagellar basal body P-ring formation chaperone FlgA [Alphaproteobacteria bacterium]|nr:flagellar basal body P-ring formation chaperone FlgA [Alphaproteobacteria bacterium]